MYQFLKIELKNCINKIEFKIIFGIVFAFCMAGFLLEVASDYGQSYQFVRSAGECVFLQSAEAEFLLKNLNLLLPIFTGLIYAGSLLDEKRVHIAGNLVIRGGKKKYLWAKAVAVFLSAFVLFAVPLFINLGLCYLFFPLEGSDSMWLEPAYLIGVSAYFPQCMLDFLRIQSPILYNLTYIFIYALCSGVLALLAYGMGFLFQNKKLAKMKMVCAITFFYLGVRLLFSFIQLPEYTMENYLATVQEGNVFGLVIVLAYHLVIAAVLIQRGIRKYDEMD